ncbi:MAG: O-antigen ligase family protein [Candidatus Kuenenbacteria bacterium]
MNQLARSKKSIFLKKIQEWLFYLFIFLLPWQTRWIFRDAKIQGNIFEYGRMSLYAFDIVLIILLIIGLIKFFIKGSKILNIRFLVLGNNKFYLSCLLFIVYCFLSIFWADEKLISFYWAVRILAGFSLFYLVQKIDFSRIRLAVVIVITASIQGLLGIWQFLNQSIWQAKWLGMAGQSARDLGSSVIEFGIERWLRAYGSLPHPNILGGFLVLCIPALFYLLSKIENKYQKLFIIFSMSFIWLGIFFSFSRSAWIAFVLINILGIIWIFKKSNGYIKKFTLTPKASDKVGAIVSVAVCDLKPQNRRYLLVSGFAKYMWAYGIIILLVFIIACLPLVKTRLNIGTPARLEIKSNTERINSFKQAGEIIRENWLPGASIGNYTFELQKNQPSAQAWDLQPVHNTYLLILAELGIIGFLIVILLNYYIVKLLIDRKKWYNLGLLFIFYCLLFFDHYFWTLASGLFAAWLILGLTVKTLSAPSESSRKKL